MALLPSSKKKSYPKVAVHSGLPAYAGSILLMAVCFVLMIFSVMNSNVTEKMQSVVLSNVTPIIDAAMAPVFFVSDFSGSVSGLTSLSQVNQDLKSENLKLAKWHQVAVSLEAENERLRALLNVPKDQGKKFITSRVIADSGSQFANSLIVPVGDERGVRKGQAVLSEKSMIGRIVKTTSNVSRVLLVTDINSRVPVSIEGSGVRAILAGDNSDTPLLTHVPEMEEIKENAVILTSGHGGVLPAGLLLGHVRYDGNGDRWVDLLSDLHKTNFVQIVDYRLDTTLE